MIKTIYRLFGVFLGLALLTACGAKQQDYSYELICQGVGTQGTKLVKVYSYAKNQREALEKAKYNAVHGVLTKGIIAAGGCYGAKPMLKPDEFARHQAFFDNFFKTGTYLRYVSISGDGSVAAGDRLRVGKLYKIGVIVSVQDANLRQYLESEGVVRKLGAVFN